MNYANCCKFAFKISCYDFSKTYVSISEPTPKTFVKAEKKTCNANAYGNYETLDEAKYNCSIDTECQGIYDMNCNGPDFKLCPIQKKIRNSSTGTSCVYVKEGTVYSENIIANDNLMTFYRLRKN